MFVRKSFKHARPSAEPAHRGRRHGHEQAKGHKGRFRGEEIAASSEGPFRDGPEGRERRGRGGHANRERRGFFGGRGGGRGRGGPGGFGDDRFTRGRKLTADELQIVIEALLHEAPAHGYELIRRLEERSGGFYKPSPGVIYPSLTYLEEAGLAAVTQEGNRKSYALTEEGLKHYESNSAEADRILDLLCRIGARMADVRDAFTGINDLDPTLGQEFHDARQALKMALKSKRGASADELRRIVKILQQAAAEIGGTSSRED
ncbi:PadR family transcriptional regulator [Gluconobacter morbifer]|uniref:Transcription regulator PadR N-terminal domain-containing protein n=1 Tax=Gluconobacter morbifer G707 TaxID=1088869 RepID=G6XJY2_9PROT|nr:PadR family transcriptional regulator [Gluconobacter morbifer]EHH67944.1 hypothetical protein GMO_17110 [Gluconobacter morbifer G707]